MTEQPPLGSQTIDQGIGGNERARPQRHERGAAVVKAVAVPNEYKRNDPTGNDSDAKQFTPAQLDAQKGNGHERHHKGGRSARERIDLREITNAIGAKQKELVAGFAFAVGVREFLLDLLARLAPGPDARLFRLSSIEGLRLTGSTDRFYPDNRGGNQREAAGSSRRQKTGVMMPVPSRRARRIAESSLLARREASIR